MDPYGKPYIAVPRQSDQNPPFILNDTSTTGLAGRLTRQAQRLEFEARRHQSPIALLRVCAKDVAGVRDFAVTVYGLFTSTIPVIVTVTGITRRQQELVSQGQPVSTAYRFTPRAEILHHGCVYYVNVEVPKEHLSRVRAATALPPINATWEGSIRQNNSYYSAWNLYSNYYNGDTPHTDGVWDGRVLTLDAHRQLLQAHNARTGPSAGGTH